MKRWLGTVWVEDKPFTTQYLKERANKIAQEAIRKIKEQQ